MVIVRAIYMGLVLIMTAVACGEEPPAGVSMQTAADVNPADLVIPDLAVGSNEVESIGALDTARYLGDWYEVASIPQWFQAFCVEGVRAQYAVRDDGNISVTNSCYDNSGAYRELVGVAGITDTTRPAELSVSFVSNDPAEFGGDYWVLYISEAYDLAVVGEPSRTYGWILSRTPFVEQADLDLAFGVFADSGYDLSRFALTDQTLYGVTE